MIVNIDKMSTDIKKTQNVFTEVMTPIVYKLPHASKSMQNASINPQLSINIDYPSFSLGFQHYIHANKEKLDLTDQFKEKKKVYRVVNRFNRYIDDHDTDIDKMSKVFFDIDPKPHIANDDFFKYWEILCMFDLCKSSSSISSAHMMENGGALQALLLFRDMFNAKGSKSDKYTIIESADENKHKDALNDKFMTYYKKEKPQRVNVSNSAKKCDIVTLSCGNHWDYRNLKEQDSLKLFLEQLSVAIECQDKGSSMICKIHESYTLALNKLVYLLSELYDETYVIKPLTSKPSNSEKFIVFKGYTNKGDKVLKIIKSILSDMKSNKNLFLVNFCKDFDLPNDFIAAIRKMNSEISNKQLINVNNIVDFINKENYFGDQYQTYRLQQIESANHWIARFYPNKKDFQNHIKEIESETKKLASLAQERIDKLSEKLV